MSFSLSGYSHHLALTTNAPCMAIYQASRVDPAIIIDDPETAHILFNATPEHCDSADFFRVHHDHAGGGPRWLEDEDKGDEDEKDEDDEDEDGKDEDALAAEQAELEHAWEAPRPAIDEGR